MAKKELPIVTARYGPDRALGVSLVNREKPLYTRCKIKAKFGDYEPELPVSFYWDGATLPRFTWAILGIEPLDPRVALASGFHDDGCNRDDVAQVIADAVFVALLGPIVWNGQRIEGLGRFKRVCCYMGVRFYSLFVRPTTRLFFRKET